MISLFQAQTKKEDLLKMYGDEILSIDDVKKVFVKFISQEVNDNGVKVGSYFGTTWAFGQGGGWKSSRGVGVHQIFSFRLSRNIKHTVTYLIL